MKYPFSTEQFLDVFRQYNEGVFPMQFIFYLMAGTAIYLAIKTSSSSDRIISVILSFLWLWMGLVYHMIFFTTINKVAYFFGAMFIVQSGLFLFFGILRHRLSFEFKKDMYGFLGMGFIVYALIIYPLLGIAGGHAYPYSPTFGLPCPTTIFTFGLILLTNHKFPMGLLIIPFLWSILGVSAALNFHMYEDWFLIIAALLTLSLIIVRNRKLSHSLQL